MNTRSHGGHLLVPDARKDELRRQSAEWPSWTVAGQSLTALEAMLAGFLRPIDGYALPGRPPPGGEGAIPMELALQLEVPSEFASTVPAEGHVALRDAEGVLLAALQVEQRMERHGGWVLGGQVEGVELPAHEDFVDVRLTPEAVIRRARALGHARLLAFFPGDMADAAVRASLVDAAERADAAILLLIASEAATHDELGDFAKVSALLISAGLLPSQRTVTAVVPMPRSDGVASVLRTALVARNCGASSLAIDPTDADANHLERLREFGARLNLEIVHVRPWSYSEELGRLVDPVNESAMSLQRPPPRAHVLSAPAEAPDWLLRPEEREALGRANVPRHLQGFTVFLTGLSGSGKSTIARALRVRLMELTGRAVTLLDGDRVRRHLSSELGFSREHRTLNVLRIGWVASEITRHRGIAICAPIAPYDAVRREVRAMVEPAGGFLLVHVATPLETCEARDRKGLYARARAGLIPQFTGVSDAYEPPSDAAVTVDTRSTSVEDACHLIVDTLISTGYVVAHS